MSRHVRSAVDFLLGRPPEEWIGALVVALLLSVMLLGVYNLCRRKMKDASMLLTVAALIVNLAGMVIAATYVGLTGIGASSATQAGTGEAVSLNALADMLIDGMASRILNGADADHNGRLSADEAAAAADGFIKRIDAEEKKPVDMRVLGAVLKRRIKPPMGSSYGTEWTRHSR
jgi:hypothetical protein